MKTVVQYRWVWLAGRLLLGVIFMAAAVTKIQDAGGFVNTVAGYGLLPDTLAKLYGWVLPWVELYIGCALILGVFVRFTAVLSILVTISFAIASTYALANSTAGPCGCFGNFINLSHPASLAIDGAMLFLALVLLQKGKAFLTVGQAFDKIPAVVNKLRYTPSLILSVVLAMGIVTAVTFGTKTIKGNNPVIENISVPAPLAVDIEKQLAAGKPVLFIVSAEGCAACEEAAPVFDKYEQEFGTRVAFMHVDYWKYESQMQEMNIINTPSVFLFNRKNTDGTFGVTLHLSKGVDELKLRGALQTVVAR